MDDDDVLGFSSKVDRFTALCVLTLVNKIDTDSQKVFCMQFVCEGTYSDCKHQDADIKILVTAGDRRVQ